MGLRDRIKRLRLSTADFHRERVQAHFANLPTTPIGQMHDREFVTIGGEVKRIRTAPHNGVLAVELVVTDGTGDATVVFTGRTSIPGISHGRKMIIEGTAHPARKRHVLMNPAYTLLPS